MGLSCGTKVVKYTLFFFNLLFWITGCVLLGIGIWILASHGSAAHYLHIANLDYGLVQAAAITIVIVGLLVFLVGGLGCCGACKENPTCLSWFAGFLIFLLVLQLIAVILAGAMHSQILHGLGTAMTKTMVNNYGQPNQTAATEAWDFMQINMHCCGVNETGPADWRNTKWWNQHLLTPVPASCCVNLTQPINYTNPTTEDAFHCYMAANNMTLHPELYVNVKGCEVSLNDWFMNSLGVLIGGTVAVIVIQIVVVIMACCLKSSIKSSYEHV